MMSNSGGNYSYTYQSGPPGLCSITQDRGLNSNVQISDNPSPFLARRGEKLVQILKSAGIQLDPHKALQLAAETSPEHWPTHDIPDILGTLLGLSMASRPDQLKDLRLALENGLGAIQGPLTSPSHSPQTIMLGIYQAVIGYGCLEVTKGTLHVRASTPFAKP